jgi:hypothetical protein
MYCCSEPTVPPSSPLSCRLSLWSNLPLRKPSPFGEPAIIHALFKQSAGLTGRVTWLLGRAAELAIRDGSEQIDSDRIDRVSDHLRIVAA